MAQPQTPPSRRNPALIFAIAAVAVLALALPLIFLQGDEPPVGGDTSTTTTPTTIPEQTTTLPETTTTTPEAPTTSIPTAVMLDWPVFMVQDPENSNTGNPALVPFYLTVTDGSDLDPSMIDSPEDILLNLEDLPVVIPEGFRNAVPEEVEIVDKSFEQTSEGLNRVTLDMNQAFLEGAGGLLADFTMLNQIIYTTLQFDLDELVFTVGGEPVEAFGSEGLSLVDQVDGTTFQEELNPIYLTEPVVIDENDVLTVRGVANVFEATVNYSLDDDDVVGHTMASCGTGCWGQFEFTMDLSDVDVEDRSIWVFTLSAENGSVIDLISVPLSAALHPPTS